MPLGATPACEHAAGLGLRAGVRVGVRVGGTGRVAALPGTWMPVMCTCALWAVTGRVAALPGTWIQRRIVGRGCSPLFHPATACWVQGTGHRARAQGYLWERKAQGPKCAGARRGSTVEALCEGPLWAAGSSPAFICLVRDPAYLPSPSPSPDADPNPDHALICLMHDPSRLFNPHITFKCFCVIPAPLALPSSASV